MISISPSFHTITLFCKVSYYLMHSLEQGIQTIIEFSMITSALQDL